MHACIQGQQTPWLMEAMPFFGPTPSFFVVDTSDYKGDPIDHWYMHCMDDDILYIDDDRDQLQVRYERCSSRSALWWQEELHCYAERQKEVRRFSLTPIHPSIHPYYWFQLIHHATHPSISNCVVDTSSSLPVNAELWSCSLKHIPAQGIPLWTGPTSHRCTE